MTLLPQRLIADKLELRAFSLDYFDDALDAVMESLPDIQMWLWWAQAPLDEDSYRAFVRSGSENFRIDVQWRYFFFERATNSLVGGCSIDVAASGDRSSAKVGYWIRTSCTGRNLATLTARILTDTAFRFLPSISSVEIGMDIANIASARIPEKLGFTNVGEFDKPIWATGHTGRGLIWAMSRSDWQRHEFTSTKKR
ncbi:MAG: GNAT family N-acetyltransferase [Acidimicrobiaceae bacterium]|nr:GNAT family N-acetyltransferase [Acidimicrobiaceae bacterium]